MKRIILPVSVILGMFVTSCVSMDMKPNSQGNSESWYSTELELKMAANRLYTIGYWSFPMEDSEQWTDNFTYRQTNRHPDMGAPLNGNLNGQAYYVSHTWEQAYKLIAQANLIINNSHRALENGVSQQVVDQYNAEAYFCRACKYADLISFFGDVPYVDHELTITEAENMTRMPKKDLIPLIYEDFEKAATILPAKYNGTQRFTKGAALAMKARFALYMSDWATAADAAKRCIDLKVYSLEPVFSNIFLQTTKEIPEKILFMPRSVALNVLLDQWFVTNELPRNVGGYGASSPSLDLLASFLCTDGKPIDESDLFDPKNPFKNRDPRCAMTIVPFGSVHCGWVYDPTAKTVRSADGATTKSNQDCRLVTQHCSYNGLLWKKRVDESWLDDSGMNSKKAENDLIVMRYADVLLMYAESKIELNEIDKSVYDAINQVRARAYGVDYTSVGSYPAVSGLDQDGLRKAVRMERRMEFANEGLRYMDLIRWGIYKEALNGFNYILPENARLETMINSGLWFWGDVVPEIDENGLADLSELLEKNLVRQGAERVFPDHQVLFPIPTYERTHMPNLSQNNGY